MKSAAQDSGPAMPPFRVRLSTPMLTLSLSLFPKSPVTQGAYYDGALREFILDYDRVRTANEPDALILDFLATTYAAAAESGRWDRESLECAMGVPGRVRPVD